MNRQIALNRISQLLSRFSEQVKLLNKAGKYDINTHAENVLIPILNEVYDLELENANKKVKNADSIDLIDKKNRTSFQVTSTSSSTKIKNTLKQFKKSKKEKDFDTLFIYNISEKQKSYSGKGFDEILDGVISFKVDEHIIDHADLYREIDLLNSQPKIETVLNILEKEFSDLKKYNEVSNLPEKIILKKFDYASFHLLEYENSLYGIKDSHIERNQTQELLEWVKNPIKDKEEPVILLVGNPGSGKTVIMKDLFLKLIEKGIPTLGLKADSNYADNINDLEKKLNLEDSFEKIINTLSQSNEKVVILIDQIDALSQSLSAKRDYLDTYNLLVRKLLAISGIRIIISVRTYDLDYDNELSFYRNQRSIKVELLEPKEVEIILMKLSIRVKDVSPQLFNLIRVPHHLNVFCKIYNQQTNLLSLKSLNDLYNELYITSIEKIPKSTLATSLKCQETINLIAEEMYKIQRISISSKPFATKYYEEISYLKSVGILVEIGDKIQFFHQTFFDYSFARQFVQSKKSVEEYLLQNHQGLFVRSSLKMIMSFLRESDHKEYIRVFKEILNSKKYRFHIRIMLLNLLGFEEEPTIEEKTLTQKDILNRKEYRIPFLESIVSEGWLNFLINSREIDRVIEVKRNLLDRVMAISLFNNENIKHLLKYKSIDRRREDRDNLIWRLFVRLLPRSRIAICKYLIVCKDFKEKPRFVFRLLYFIKEWDFEEGFTLFEKYSDEAQNDQHSYYNILEDIAKYDYDWVIKKYTVRCEELISNVIKPNDKPQFEYGDTELIKVLFEENNYSTILFLIKLIEKISIKTSVEKNGALYKDFSFGLFDYDNGGSSHHYNRIYSFLKEKLEHLAVNDGPYFLDVYNDWKQNNSITILRLFFFGFQTEPKKYKDEIFDFIMIFYDKGGLEDGGKIQYQFRSLLKEVYTHLDDNQKDRIDDIILSIRSSYEFEITSDREGNKRHWLESYGQKMFLYLNCIPKEEIKIRPKIKKKFLELSRKFNEIKDEEPNTFHTIGVGAPLNTSAYERMTYDQWKHTFRKFNKEYEPPFHSSRGSIIEHKRAFESEVENRPEHFYNLIKELTKDDTIPVDYIVAGITGLKNAKYSIDKVQELFKIAMTLKMNRENTLYLVWVTSYFINNRIMDEEILDYLINLAKNHPDPKMNDEKDDLIMQAANSVRGAAAQRITQIYFKPEFENKVFNSLDEISQDQNLSVKVSIMPRLAILMNLNEEKTLSLFLKLVEAREFNVMAQSHWSVQYLANNNFKELIAYFQDAIEIKELQGDISTILAVAWIKDIAGSKPFLDKVLSKSNIAKAKALYVAIKNFGDEKERVFNKCYSLYVRFLPSKNKEVIETYSRGFLDFDNSLFVKILPAIKKYSKSYAVKKNPHDFLVYLLQCSKKYPIECLELLQKVNSYDQPDISESSYYDDEPIKVLMGVYNSLSSMKKVDNKSLEKSMKLFDNMLMNNKLRNAANNVIEMIES